MRDDLEQATALIVDIHQFFTDWISGRCPKKKGLFLEKAKKHLSAGFFGILPSGWSFNLGIFSESHVGKPGKSPKFQDQNS